MRQSLVHDGDRPDAAHGLLQRRPRLGRAQPPGLQPQQRGDGLQVVLHPVMDLPDGGFLGEQLALPAAQFSDIPDEDKRAGPLSPDHQGDGAQLNDRAVAVDLRLPWSPAAGDQHQRLVDRFPWPAQLRGRRAEFGAHEVRGKPEAAVGRLGVGAGVGDAARTVQAQQPIADPGRAHQRRVLVRVGKRPLRHHPRQVVATLEVGELEPAGRASRVQVGGPLDDRDDPAVPGHRYRLGADRHAAGPVRVALAPDAPLTARRVEQRPLSRTDVLTHDVVGEGGGTGRRPHLGDGNPSDAGRTRRSTQRHPQDQVGEGQVREKLPVGHQGVQPLHVAAGQVCVVPREVGQGRHFPIMTRAGQQKFP